MRTINNCDSEDRYLKIYYPDSEKFVEFPLDDEDGKLLFIDVKVVEPNIFALNLIKPNNGGGKLYKPKNGCFKEPKEKWSYFKVLAVLKPSVNQTITAKSPISDTSSNINQLLPINVISTENETIRKNKKVKDFTEDLPSPSIQSPTDLTLNSIENVSKKKSKNIIQSSPTPSVQSMNEVEIISSKESCFKAKITDAEIFAAYSVSNIYELKELLCDGNQIFNESFTYLAANLHLWKETIISNSSNLQIIKILFYAFNSNILLKTLNSNVSDYCKICDKKFTLHHLVGKWHVNKYRSIFNTDPPEISIILNPDNFVHFIPTDVLCKMNIFSNNWYDKYAFDTLKEYIIYRIKEAQLYFSFKDPSFIEKLLFLNETFMQFPKLRDIFPKSSYCIKCHKNLQSFSCVVTHLLSKDHITMSLTQNELDKLVNAVSFIRYSDIGGFYYTSFIPFEKRKRSHPKEIALETPSKRHIIFSDSDS